LLLGVTFINLQAMAPEFQVFGYYQKDGDLFHVVPLTPPTEMTPDTLANLFFAMAAFAMAMDVNTMPQNTPTGQDLPYPTGTGGVCLIGKTRVKVLNYEGFQGQLSRSSVPQEERRSAHFAPLMIRECKWLPLGGGLDMILYPDFAGDHRPHHTSCVAACIDHLHKAHCTGIIHADLHLANFLFNKDLPEASLILDWDHARSVKNPGRYVPGWQQLSERHEDAKARCPVRLEHDLHSLCAVLKQFEPIDFTRAEVWATLWTSEGLATRDLKMLATTVRDLDIPLKLVQEPAESKATGSPSRVSDLATISEDLSALRVTDNKSTKTTDKPSKQRR